MLISRKTVVIAGALSSVGRAIADQFARRGFSILLAGRDVDELKCLADDIKVRHEVSCSVRFFDALDFASHGGFLDQCVESFGNTPGGVVYCAGYMADQELAQMDFATAKRTLDTNLSGAVSLLEKFAALFEECGSGFIAALSSVAGDRGRKSNYINGAAKAGLTAYLSGLRNRLYSANVQVITIKPGFMDTAMTWGMPLPAPLTASPEAAAKAMVKAILRGANVIYVPFFWRWIMMIIRYIPEWQFKKMNI